MLRTAIYLRKSSDETTDKQLQSIERQQRDVFDFIERHNVGEASPEFRLFYNPHKDVFREERSAKRPGRPVFAEMLALIHKHKYDVLLCSDLSRLSRNPIDTGALTHAFDQRLLLQVRTVDKVFRQNPSDIFTFQLFLSVAKYENDQKGLNSASGTAASKLKGGTTNLAPMGYLNVGHIKGHKGVEADGENFDKIKGLWEKLATGQFSVAEVAKMGVELGITRAKNYKGGSPNYVPVPAKAYRDMFSNRYYLGLIVMRGAVVQGRHPAMVDQATFDKVQAVLQQNGYRSVRERPTMDNQNVLSQLLHSGKSGETMHLDVKIRYTCQAATYASTPMMGLIPSLLQALKNSKAPYRLPPSVRASAVMPSFLACATKSSGAPRPWRNE